MNRTGKIIAAVLGLTFATAANAVPTEIVVRVLARDGKLVGNPAGGISPDFTLRATFSHTSGCRAGSPGGTPSSDRPPVFALALWHVAQYRVTIASRSTTPAERSKGNTRGT